MEERFVSPCPPPTPYEREITEVLIEECAEVIQRATKLLRFGVFEVEPGTTFPNNTRLGTEVGDLLEVIDRAIEAGVIDSVAVTIGRAAKRRQLAKFLQHAPAEEKKSPEGVDG